jgi:hypothetical protein
MSQGGNPPPMDITGGSSGGAPGPIKKPELSPIFKDMVKTESNFKKKGVVVNNVNKDADIQKVVKEIKLPNVDYAVRKDSSKKEFKEKLNILNNKRQQIDLRMGRLFIQKEQLMDDSTQMLVFANRYNLGELNVLLNEWLDFNHNV